MKFYAQLKRKLNAYRSSKRGFLNNSNQIIMRINLTVFLLIFCLIQVNAAGFAQRITFNKRDASLKQVLKEIRLQTGYHVFYNAEELRQTKRIHARFNNESLDKVLKICFEYQPVTYTVKNKTIIIQSKLSVNTEGNLNEVKVIPVQGRITDSKKQPIPGVNIMLKGTKVTSTSDQNGNYKIMVLGESAVLVYSFIGFEHEEIAVNGRTEINVVLKEKFTGLEEIVVVGYGTQKKSDVTGSISSISGKDLREKPATSVRQMLQGKAAGVYVTSNGNRPGDEASVLIRGRRSFDAGNDPLYVVDGIPINGGFNDINPDDIESLDILKDASATAIYGSRGANGVVIVTTRRGKTGAPVINYNGYAGVSAISRYINMMDGPQYAEYKRESRRANGTYIDSDPDADKKLFEAVELASIAEQGTNDWQRQMLENGFKQNHELNVNGGSEQTKYSVSLGILNDKGYIPVQDFQRYTTRVNLDQSIGKFVKTGVSILGSHSIINAANPYYNTLISNPLTKAYDQNGELIFQPGNDALLQNPLSDLVDGAVINKRKRFRMLTSVYAEAELLKGLTLRTNFGPDLIQERSGIFNGSKTTARNLAQPTASTAESFTALYTWENILKYSRTLTEKHKFDFTGLYSVSSMVNESTNINVLGLPVESFEYHNLGAAAQINGVGSAYVKWTILSYMGRFNYSFDNKYLITVTGRADGSSRFAENHKWGFFPSAALGWNLKNEGFLENNRHVDLLKLRLSYGKTGNTGIDPYKTQGLLGRTVYDFDGKEAFGYAPSSIRNEELRWESTASANIGLDFGLLNNRLKGTFELYRSTTTDLLLPKVLPISGGFDRVLQNVGSTRNTGFEVTLSSQNLVPKTERGLSWSTDLNLAHNKERILELSQGKVDDIGNARFIGQPLTVYYDYEKIGIWQLGEEVEAAKYASAVGSIKVSDVNNNGKIDAGDRHIIGTSQPSLTGGLTNRFGYKNFNLSIFLQARFGSMFQSSVYQGNTFALQGRYNNLNVNYWTKNNPTNDYPQPNYGKQTPYFATTLSYFDASFVRIRNIYLSYDFSSEVFKKLGAKSLRLYTSVQDPFVFAPYVRKYNGTDPEIAGSPALVTYTLGINASF